MDTIKKTLTLLSIVLLIFAIDVLNEIHSELNFVTEAGARVPGPVGVGGVGVAGVARRSTRRTTRRIAVGTTAVASSAAATAQDSPDVVVVEQTTQPASQSGTAVPLGTIITSLPAGCSSVAVQGGTYFNCGGVYYQPSYQGNILVYIVVPAP